MTFGGARLSLLEHVQQIRAKLREDRHEPLAPAFVVFSLAARHADAVVLPIYVSSYQRQVLGWAAQPAVAAQGEQ